MKALKIAIVAALSLTAAACSNSDEDTVADYLAEYKDGKYEAEASCIAEAMTADVGTNQMQEWAEKIQKDGKMGTFDLSFAKNVSDAVKKCVE